MSLDMKRLADLALDRHEATEERWRELRRISFLWLTASGALMAGDPRVAARLEAAMALPESADYETIRAALGFGWEAIAEEPPAAPPAPKASAAPPPATDGHADRGVP